MTKNIMSTEELNDFLHKEMPQVSDMVSVLEVNGMEAIIALTPSERNLRPGGTVSGPSLFLLADVGFYLNLLSVIGPVPLAVTTNASINFMRKPDLSGLIGVSKIMKLGKRLAVGDVVIYATSDKDRQSPLAHATMTYAIPSTRPGQKQGS